MNANRSKGGLSRIAAAIGEPARSRMLLSLLDGHARTSTELSIIAGVTPSTGSVHLRRLEQDRLVKTHRQGRHHYYGLSGPEAARALEALQVVAGAPRAGFTPSTPGPLLLARTCYDHMAGRLGVLLHDRFTQMQWMAIDSSGGGIYQVTSGGWKMLAALGIEPESLAAARRKLAYPCLDWSERRPHIGGALGAALLQAFLQKRWIARDPDSRAVSITSAGKRDLAKKFSVVF
ncbi:MAG: helix-turn-helix transcriptional regulator [Acidobacteria bacterium]|nr:helix-turn-helix transcriptional regulator [Acidobacteriota bacterium]